MSNPAHSSREEAVWAVPKYAENESESSRSMVLVTTRKIRTETETQEFYVDVERFKRIRHCDITLAPAELVELFCRAELGMGMALRGKSSESAGTETYIGFRTPDDEQFRI